MKKGDAAREAVKNKIIEAFGDDFAGVQDKKIFINVKDGPGGEVVQMAISMTMPKTPIGKVAASDGGAFPSTTEQKPNPTELSDEDKSEVARLMERLGIS